jgi:hypothetical protein
MPKATTKTQPGRSDFQSDELRRQIAEAAYYRAQQRGFEPGLEEQDWLEAEAEVMRRDSSRQTPS